MYLHVCRCVDMGQSSLLFWQSQNSTSRIHASGVDRRRNSTPSSLGEGRILRVLLCFCISPRQLHSERTTKSPPLQLPRDITGLWPWPHGSRRTDLIRTASIFPPPLGGQWAGKWRTQCRFTRLIIRSQLIPIPIIWQLGPTNQHMPSYPVPGSPAWKHPFFLAGPPPAGPRRPSNTNLLRTAQSTLGKWRHFGE